MKRFLISTVILLCAFTFQNIYAQTNIKIGIVDVVTVIKQMPEAEQGDKFLQDLAKKYADTLERLQKDLKEKFEGYQKQKGMMPAAEQQKTEETLLAQNQKLEQYKSEKFGQQGELAQRREGIMEPIKDKVKKAIEEVAKEEKLTIVFEKGTSVIYNDEKFEITFKILDKIKRGNSEEKKK